MEISISAIEVPSRLRSMNHERVEAIKASITELGLLNAVTVCARDKGKYVLAAGAHRLQAARELGRDSIEANIVKGSDIDRQMIEIDENLCRSDLSPAQRALHVTRRKELWIARQALNQQRANADVDPVLDTGAYELGETDCSTQPAGVKPSIDSDEVQGHVDARGQRKSLQQRPGFAASTAAISGESKVEVNRNVRRGERLGGEILRDITGTPLDKGVELDALARLPKEKRAELVDRVKAGEAVTARGTEAIKAPVDRNRALAKCAIKALEKCASSMSPGEFKHAVRSLTLSRDAMLCVEVLLTSQ